MLCETNSKCLFGFGRNKREKEPLFNAHLIDADEIRKLAKLKEEGILTDEEFKQMKQDLIRKNI
jgi:Short C-terminal domain